MKTISNWGRGVDFKRSCLTAINTGRENADKILQPALDATWLLIENSSEVIGRASDNIVRDTSSDEDLILLKLTNCLSDTLCALISTMQGFTHPPAVVMRAVLESLACVICFRQDKDALSAYKAGKYDPTDAIAVAKKTHHEFAKLNGMLSNAFVHEKSDTVGRALAIKGNTTALMLIPPLDEHFNKLQLLTLLIIASMVYKIGEIAEWCFARVLPELKEWEHIDQDNLKSISSPQKDLLKLITKQMEEKLAEMDRAAKPR